MKQLFRGISILTRMAVQTEHPVFTRNGNYLIDCRFTELPELQSLQNECKNIPGVVEISLFYKMVSQAIIAHDHEIRMYERNGDGVSFINWNLW